MQIQVNVNNILESTIGHKLTDFCKDISHKLQMKNLPRHYIL